MICERKLVLNRTSIRKHMRKRHNLSIVDYETRFKIDENIHSHKAISTIDKTSQACAKIKSEPSVQTVPRKVRGCGQCDYDAKSKSSLDRHVKAVHDKIRDYV